MVTGVSIHLIAFLLSHEQKRKGHYISEEHHVFSNQQSTILQLNQLFAASFRVFPWTILLSSLDLKAFPTFPDSHDD